MTPLRRGFSSLLLPTAPGRSPPFRVGVAKLTIADPQSPWSAFGKHGELLFPTRTGHSSQPRWVEWRLAPVPSEAQDLIIVRGLHT